MAAGVDEEIDMETMRLSIHEVIKTAVHVEDVELIDVPVDGEPITLLRNKAMSAFAFVMWVSEMTGTRTQMQFNLPNDATSGYYPVVCACCSSELHGLKGPNSETEKDAYKAWEEEKRAMFKGAVEATCKAQGINTLFMRHAHVWEKRYGRIDGIQFVEAREFVEAMTELYSRQTIREGFRFFHF